MGSIAWRYASLSEATVGLPKTSVKESECRVRLENFWGSSNKLKMMMCSHFFHEPSAGS